MKKILTIDNIKKFNLSFFEKKIEKLNIKINNTGVKSQNKSEKIFYNLNFFQKFKRKLTLVKNILYFELKFKKFIFKYKISEEGTKGYKLKIFDKTRYYGFFEIIQKYEIKSVLELGSGSSTLFFNEFINCKKGCFYTFDQDKNIINLVKKKLPKNQKKISFCYSKVDIVYEKNELFLKYKDIKRIYYKDFDLVYIDAPVLAHGNKIKNYFLLNYIFDLVEKVNFKVILFDKKFYNISILEKYLNLNLFEIKNDVYNHCFYVIKK